MLLAKAVANDPIHLVDESLLGLVLARPDLELLPHRVVTRSFIDRSKVALVCGGGAGHEPAHAAFVGAGMLTAAVSGDIFASPTAAAVEAALRAVAGAAGTLLLVKNYTGDRLAFSAAAEKARLLGARVEVVYVADDAALEGGAAVGRRGLAGTVLVYKVAGALAEAGAPLEVVAGAARSAAARVATFGASLTVCAIPGRAPSDRLDGAAMELGMGIHGEPGATRLEAVPSADELVARALAPLAAALRGASAPGATAVPIALLVNNYGGLSQLELGGVVRAAVAWLDAASAAAAHPPPPRLLLTRLIAGTVMTSLSMRGFSLSLLPLGPLLPSDAVPHAEVLLDAPTGVGGAWPGAAAPREGWDRICLAAAHPRGEAETAAAVLGGALPAALAASGASAGAAAGALLAVLEAAAGALLGAEGALNALDARVGDGDTGATFAAIARAALAHAAPALRAAAAGAPPPTAVALRAAPVRPLLLPALLEDVGDAVAGGVGGSSGLLYALLLRAAAAGARAQPAAPLGRVFGAALAALGAAANSREGQRSMLDALGPAARALEAAAGGEGGGALCARALDAVAAAASGGAAATAGMAPVVGRASWVAREVAAGVQDPGAAAAALWVAAVAGAIKGLPPQ
jgi:dihydroxyacetone kinase